MRNYGVVFVVGAALPAVWFVGVLCRAARYVDCQEWANASNLYAFLDCLREEFMIKLCAFADEYGKQIDAQIEGLTKNNIHLVELRNVDGKNIADITDEEAVACYGKLSAAGIAVWSLGSPMGKVDINCDWEEYKQKKVHRLCHIANLVRTDKIRMFSFYNAYDNREKVLDYLAEMTAIAAEYGVTLYHENEKEIYGDTLERVLDLVDNAKGLKFVYDPANFIQCGQGSDRTIAALFDKTAYFHVKDVIAATQQLVPAGYGDGNIDKIIARIDPTKETVMTIEPHLAVFDGYAQIDNSEMKNKFNYPDNHAAFNAAVEAIKKLLVDGGYTETADGFVK